MYPLQSVTYKIGKSCCCKYGLDNLVHDGTDCLFWMYEQESSECEGGNCK
jgi:hypothetical protein